MSALEQHESAYWEAFMQSLPPKKRPTNPNVAAAIAGNPEIADELLALCLSLNDHLKSGHT